MLELTICSPAIRWMHGENLLCVAALDSPTADLRDELKEQLAEEEAQKAKPAQPKTPNSFKKAPSLLPSDHAANGTPIHSPSRVLVLPPFLSLWAALCSN